MRQLAKLLTAATEQYPEVTAIEDPSGSLTYAALATEAGKAAEELSSRSASTVAITGERSARLFVLLIGAVLADRAVVLIDPELPSRRREHMVTASGADRVVTVAGDHHFYGEQSRPRHRHSSDYVFFTSGTTGEPKAIGGRWESVAHFTTWQGSAIGIGPGDRVAQLTGLSFDVVLRDVFSTLIAGATLCVPPASVLNGSSRVLDWLRAERITIAHAVPSLAARWLATEGQSAAEGSIRATFFAGEPLTSALVCRWLECFPGATVVNLYGPTETTLAKFHYRVDLSFEGLQPVGLPLPDTEVRVTDEEIWIHTQAGTDGYLGADDATRRAFTVDTEGRTWYRTGDVGHIDDDGLLWVLGRKDTQVKINGNRIEPTGVAASLSGHPEVTHAVVVPHRREDGTAYLVAFFTSEAEVDVDELRCWLAERLPVAHLPAVLHRLPEMPITANGKVDRAALPDPSALRGAGADPERSSTELDAAVLAEFRAVVPECGHDMRADFFAYGGTSIEAVDLAVRLKAATGKRWDMSDIYRLRTPRALAGAVEDRPDNDDATIPHLRNQPGETGLSPQQRRYRRVYMPRVNRSWANMVALFELPAGVEERAVAAALNTVLARHDSLRAYFEFTDGHELTQRFVSHGDVEVAVADLGSDPPEQLAELIEKLRLDEANRLIDIDRWPLFRATLIKHGGNQRTLLWNVHHMVSDGYSQGLLRVELRRLLSGEDAEALPGLPISYRDYIAWAAGPGSEAAARQCEWWREVFADHYERPLLARRTGVEDPAGGIAYQIPIPDDVRAAVDDLCRRTGVTPFTTYLTGLFGSAYRLFDTDDLVIGTPASGRLRPEFEHMIGNFISLVGIRCRRDEEHGFGARVQLVRDRTVAAMEHQGYQYDQVMADIGAEPDDDRFPLTTVFLSLIDIPAPLADEAAHRRLGCEVKFDLMGYLKRCDGRLWLEFQTRRELMTERQLEAAAAELIDCVREGVRIS